MPSEPQQGAKIALHTKLGMPLAAGFSESHEIGLRAEQQEANVGLHTALAVPPAAPTHEIGGGNVSGGDRASNALKTSAVMPAAANIRGQGFREYQTAPAPSGESDEALAATVQALSELQKQRRFCIISQSRADRACEAFIARYLGYRPDLPAPEGQAIWKQAAALRKAVEKGGEGQNHRDDQLRAAPAACTPIILNSATAREAWDNHRKQVEKQMRKLALTLHVWPWVKSVSGLGELGLAIIVGETGDLSNYATKERVWKRLGLAVIDGERQQRKSNADLAMIHGYNPKRRAEIWAVTDSLFRQQWRGARDETPAGPIGPYGEVYGRRKAHTVSRDDWTPKHRDNDARRIMAKALIEDLWRVWRGLPALCGKGCD